MRRYGYGVVVLLAIVLLGFATFISSVYHPIESLFADEPDSIVTETPTIISFWWRHEQMALLQEDLATLDLDADTRRAYEDEIQRMESSLTAIAESRSALAATSRSNLADRTISAPTSTPVATLMPPPTGILENFNTPPILKGVRIVSAWQNWVEGDWIEVYSGHLSSYLEQGVIFVIPSGEAVNTSSQSEGLILSPVKGGALYITEATTSTLTLQDEKGTTFLFDIQNMNLTTKTE